MAASFRVGSVIACLIGATLFAADVCDAATEKALKDDGKLTKLFEERAKLADQSYKACAAGYEAGTIILDTVLAAANESTEANLALCKTKTERIAVREEQVKRAEDREAKVKALNKVAARGGEDDKLARAGVERVKAEIALELEKRNATGAVK